jgi:hypothetical protein
MLPRKLSGDDQKTEGTIPYVDKINMQQWSLVDRREIRIVMGIKDQYVVTGPEAADNTGNLISRTTFD